MKNSSSEDERQLYGQYFVPWCKPALQWDGPAHWKRDNLIPADALTALRTFAHLLSVTSVERKIDPTSVEALLTKVEGLISEVTSTDDLASDVRSMLVQHLSRIADRLRHVRIYGRAGVEEAIGRACLEVVAMEDSAAAKGARSRFARFVRSDSYQAFRTLLEDAANIIERVPTSFLQVGRG